MATMSGWYPGQDGQESISEKGGPPTPGGDPRQLYRIRPLPNEAVCFYIKTIDNSRVARPSDPRARRVQLRTLALALLVGVAALGIVAPNVFTMIANYKIQQLELEYGELLAIDKMLEYQEAKLLSPERMRELAAQQGFIDPPAERVYRLSPKGDESYALNVSGKR
jgi:hypothetical protein